MAKSCNFKIAPNPIVQISQQTTMEIYQTRKIKFKELIKLDDWLIKVYLIAKTGEFEDDSFYENVQTVLPKWLSYDNGFDSSNDRIAFLILHAGTEGVFSLINWWVGKNMLNTHIFLSKYDQIDQFKMISGAGLAPCIWELEVINHERVSWINNILKSSNPDYANYLNEVINKEL
jgi:hypothetical protein